MAKKLNLAGVHVLRKIPGSQQYALAETHPAMRIAQGDNALYIQDGQVWSAGGDLVKPTEIPGWFLEEVKKVNPKALVECGFTHIPEKKAGKKAAAAQPEA